MNRIVLCLLTTLGAPLFAADQAPAPAVASSSSQSFSNVLVIGPRKDGVVPGVIPLGGGGAVRRDPVRPVDPVEEEGRRRVKVYVVGIPPESPSKATIYENHTQGALVVVGPK